jgi:hypothetical protein
MNETCSDVSQKDLSFQVGANSLPQNIFYIDRFLLETTC